MNKGRDLKPHLGIFGKRNTGKSSFINIITNQEIAIVSEQAGTTTDPVKKSIEIFGVGPVVIIDTAGIDDSGALGEKRISKTIEIIKIIDAAILIICENTFDNYEINLIAKFKEFDIPFFIIHNKNDLNKLSSETTHQIKKVTDTAVIDFSSLFSVNTEEIIDNIKRIIPETSYSKSSLFLDLINPKDYVLLVTPIDAEAPEGRMILPQVMALRDVLDNDCICITLKETELEHFFKTSDIVPSCVVTDSQAFNYVSKIVPNEIPLTSFSILFAQLKGNFEAYLNGTSAISQLKNGNKVLIMESCSHRVNCDDIGRFKLPKWLKDFTKKELEFEFVSGNNKPMCEMEYYALVIQCGGCMFTRKQVMNRLLPAINANVPVTNYGMAIAYINGIFERTTRIFKHTNQMIL
jgi:[FeFe] hydrogenase H-cluster maturation GTPase HydF